MSKYGVFSGPNTGKYRPEKNAYLDTFHTVLELKNTNLNGAQSYLIKYSGMQSSFKDIQNALKHSRHSENAWTLEHSEDTWHFGIWGVLEGYSST